MGLAAPIGSLSPSRQDDPLGFFPVSMDRCVLVTQGRQRLCMARRYETLERPVDWAESFCERGSPTWHCKIVPGVRGHLVQDWWLLISQSEKFQPRLTVIQPSSALPKDSGLSGLLAARITFRLHVLQRRGLFQGDFNKRRIVQVVNQQILGAMNNLPG